MPRRSIGGQGLEQGGKSLGNDYSRDISREVANRNTTDIIIEKKDNDEDENEEVELPEDESGQQELPPK